MFKKTHQNVFGIHISKLFRRRGVSTPPPHKLHAGKNMKSNIQIFGQLKAKPVAMHTK